jgi:hypothetical protein
MIVFEIILAVIIFYAGKMTWQLFKRSRLLKTMANNRAEMAACISIENIDALIQKNPAYIQKGPGGYVGNISLLIDIDLSTQRRLKLLFGSITVLALVVSAYAGIAFFCVSVSLFLLAGLSPLSEAARQNARDLVVTLGAILYAWRKENKKECEVWIEQASSLQELYALIQTLK